jgi:hypothetical protein
MENVIAALFPICMIFGVFALVIGIFVFLFVQADRRRKQWAAFAAEHGLHYVGGSWLSVGQVYGDLEGYPVKLWVFTRGGGKNKTTYTGVSTGIRPALGLGLSVYREHLFSGLGKMLGFQDIQTGDRRFDERFAVKGRREEEVLLALGPEARSAILRYDDLVGGGKVQDEEIYWEMLGVASDMGRVRSVWRAQREVAHALSTSLGAGRAGL